ncbi:MAG: glycosyl hydrolase 53 family protein, partial [Bacteroidaceae bacterium]|nr:glycosyl hydrolase 53 family protein [Bacteroidaceae bacterium]
MSFKYNASKVTIAGTEYETSAIDSITLDAPASMKFRGGDVSLLTRYEENGANYMDVNGTKITNMLAYLKQQGWNALRVRLFVDPSQASTADKGQGVCQNLDYVIALGKRIKRAGFQFLLDFHYSDSWADPSKQFTPAAWSSLSANELYTKIYDYTKDALQQLVAADATPDFIQTGNEISYGMLWGTSTAAASSLKKCYTSSTDNWDYFTTLLKQAGKACREVCPKAKIVIHTERAGQANVLNEFYERMKNYGVDYDIIGLSYYPYYHGTLSTLKSNLETLASKYANKKIMIVETGYYHDWQPSD